MLIFIYPPGPTHPLPIFCSEIAPKLKETVTEKFREHRYFLAGGHPSMGTCGLPSLGIQVKGDTESNLIFTAESLK